MKTRFGARRRQELRAPKANGKIGEIYVIGVDPEFQGLGLGSQLTLAGLESSHARGADEGMLYVDGANRAAQSMYERLGLRSHPPRPGLSRDIARAGAPTE